MAEKAKRLLAKMRFMEMLAARTDLSALQLRLGIYLTSRFNFRKGFAHPPLTMIADELGATARGIQKAVQALEAKGLFHVKHGRGKGNASEYTPRWILAPADGDVWQFFMAEKTNAGSPFPSENGPSQNTNAGTQKTNAGDAKDEQLSSPQPSYPTELDSNRSSAEASPGGDALRLEDENSEENIGQFLARIEHGLKAEIISNDKKIELWFWLREVAKQREGHTGDRIGGWAMRLADDIEMCTDWPPR